MVDLLIREGIVIVDSHVAKELHTIISKAHITSLVAIVCVHV